MNGEELKSAIKGYRFQGKIFHNIAMACFFGGFAMIVLDNLLPGLIVMFVGGIAFALLEYNCRQKIKQILIDNVITAVIADVLGEDAEYSPQERIEPQRMVLPGSYNKIQGEDRIRAVYRGLHIEMSDLTLIDEQETEDSEGNTVVNRVTVFDGQWMICDYGRKLKGDVFVSSYGKKKDGRQKTDIHMDNEEFHNLFLVEADVPEEAYYILTPQVMEAILDLSRNLGERLFLSFLHDGKMNVAIGNRQFFELGDTTAYFDVLRQKFTNELKVFTDVIDALRIDETISEKEVVA